MNHPDDNALPADPAAIDIPIDGATPEKAREWRDLRCHPITFHPIADRKDVTMRDMYISDELGGLKLLAAARSGWPHAA
jgi:hypothetical protein